MALSLSELFLDALAVAEDDLTLTALRKVGSLSGARRLTHDAVRSVVEELKVQGLLTVPARVSLRADLREPRVRSLWREGRYAEVVGWVAEAEPFGESTRWYTTTRRPGTVRREARRALLSGDADRYRLLGWGGSVAPWLVEPLERDLIEGLPPRLGGVAVEHLAHRWLYDGHTVPGLPELMAHLAHQVGTSVYRRFHSYALLFRGEPLGDMRQGLDELGADLLGLEALQRGDARSATEHYATFLKAYRRDKRTRLPNTPAGWFLPLAYLATGLKTRRKQALKLLDRQEDYGVFGAMEGWSCLRSLELGEPQPTLATTHLVAALYAGLAARWSDLDVDDDALGQAERTALDCGLDWVAAQLAEVRAGEGEGLLALREVRSDWEVRLEAVLQEVRGAKTAVERERRIAWTLHRYSSDVWLEAREQVRQRRGWSKGRKVANDRLYEGGVELSEADLALVGALRKQTYRGHRGYPEVEWSWVEDLVWRALAGHPAVFDAEGRQLTVALRPPRLEVARRGGRVEVTVDPPADDGGLWVTPVGEAGYEVTVFDIRQQRLAELLQGLSIPSSKTGAIERLLQAMAPVFELPRDADGDEVAGDAGVVVALRPSGPGLSAEPVVLPRGESGPVLTPGRGSEVLLVAEGSRSVRVRRDLQAEVRSLGEVGALLGRHASYEGSRFVTEDPADALQLLGALRDAAVPSLWPEGESLRLVRPSSPGSLSLDVATADEWFRARGSLKVEDGRVLALDALLTAVLGGSGRFICLDDGAFLELTERLHRQLDALARVARRRGKGVEVHALASDGLAGLVEETDGRTDAGWRAHRERLASLPERPAVPRELRARLRGYQEDAYRWLVRLAALPAGAVLADDMGLGKTVVTLAVLLQRRAEGPALVLAPTSVAGNWAREARRFAPTLGVHRLRDADRSALLAGVGAGDLVLVSYGLLVTEAEALAGIRWATVVFDESQALKNPATKRHKAARALDAGLRLALTGTPVENHLGELHAHFAVLQPGMLGSARQFRERFQAPIEAGDRAVAGQLRRLIRPYLLRRTKAEVLDDLPPRTEVDVMVDMDADEAALYEALRRRAAAEVEASNTMGLLAQLTRLRLAACSPRLVDPALGLVGAKRRALAALVEHLRAGEHRALVFSQFVKHLELVREWLDDQGVPYQVLDGSTPARERDRRVEAFQQGEGDLFLISLRAGGFGLNLTAADFVIHLDPWWNPAVEDQASDRAHRIGQDRPVTVYRLITRGTVEESILALHRRKRELAADLLEGSDAAARLSTDELRALISAGMR